jgi:hypothetical protein
MPGEPMNEAERIQAYWEAADANPEMLASFYLNFHLFASVEFHVFSDRLSAAILVANSARHAVKQLTDGLQKERQEGSHRLPGWEGECDEAMESSLQVVQDAERFAVGAAIVTAVAALEGLLSDLVDDPTLKRAGLSRLLTVFLRDNNASEGDSQEIREMLAEVKALRNQFAHALAGSFFEDPDSTPSISFDSDAFHGALFAVAGVAVELEALWNADQFADENDET